MSDALAASVSIEMRSPSRCKASASALLVDWLPSIGVDDLRPAVLGNPHLDRLDRQGHQRADMRDGRLSRHQPKPRRGFAGTAEGRAANIPLQDDTVGEPWGVRSLYVRDPAGKLISILQHE